MLNKQPSKEYIKNINYYKKMHLEGYTLIDGRKRSPVDAYNGKSTLIYAKLIKEIIEKNNIKTMLDYGCGKGFYYDNSFNSNGLKMYVSKLILTSFMAKPHFTTFLDMFVLAKTLFSINFIHFK